jgi:hypothetical protein
VTTSAMRKNSGIDRMPGRYVQRARAVARLSLDEQPPRQPRAS